MIVLQTYNTVPCSEVTPGVYVHNTKSTTIDIHCETQNGSHFFVEVQLCAMPTDAMFKRFELYSAQLLVEMWKNLPTVRHGYRRYSELQPLHCLVIVDFKITVFENELLSESGVHKFQTFHVPSMKPMSNLHFLQDYTYTSDKNILYARRLVVYRNQRRWWCKKQGNKDCD